MSASRTTGFFNYISQDIVLSRAGQLVAFGTTHASPSLASFGIQVTTTSVTCQMQFCAAIPQGTHVAAGGAEADLAQGQTAQIGKLSFTVEENSSLLVAGNCDANGRRSMGGFMAP